MRPVLPDDRLAHTEVSDNGVMTFAYRTEHIHPLLFRDLAELSRHITRSGMFDLDLSRAGQEPLFTVWMELDPATDWAPDRVLASRVSNRNGPPSFELRIRDGAIDPALMREMNEYAMPLICGALIPRVM